MRVNASPARVVRPAAQQLTPQPSRTASRPVARSIDQFEAKPKTASSSSALTGAPPPQPANPFQPWIEQTFQKLLHRAPTAAELKANTDWFNKELAAGKHVFTAGAEIVFFIKLGDEYKKLHPLASFIDNVYEKELGRHPNDDEINQSEDALKNFGAQGKQFLECCAAFSDSVHASPEAAQYRAAHPFAQWINELFVKGLGRLPTDEERKGTEDLIGKHLSEGGNIFSAGAMCDWLLRMSPEFKQKHPFAEWLDGEYQQTLGRRPSLDEVINCEGAIGRYMAEGHDVFQAGALIDFLIKLSDEYKGKHPAPGVDTNRDDFYLHQPTGSTCAPTSLAMAEAAWGISPANDDTVWRLANGMNSVHGLPGNASLIAEQAQRDGLNATYNTSRDAGAVRAALEAGHTCVVNGSLGTTGGHFLYIAGLDANGNFIVCDPWRPGITTWNDGDLNYFTHIGQQNPPGFAEIWK